MAKNPELEPVSVLQRVRELVAKAHDLPVTEIAPDTHFYDDLEDSLTVVELVMECEELFKIEIPDEDARRIMTVGQLVACIEAALREQKR